MTNELEKQFFSTFGIEPNNVFKGCTLGAKYYSEICKEETCNNCDCEIREIVYPQITDHILLKLICILTRFYGELVLEQCLDVKDLKEQVLNIFIRTSYKDNFKHQVCTLFEER